MRLPKFIEFEGRVWRFKGANLRDKIPQIRETMANFLMSADKAVVGHCYEPYLGSPPVGTVRWEDWKASRKSK